MDTILEEQLEAIAGYYVPSFFRIKLNIPNSDIIHPQNMTVGAYSVYFHEYVHYIQDVTSNFGLMNLSTISFYVREVASSIGKQTTGPFSVPQIIQKRDIIGYENWYLKHLYYGNGKEVKERYKEFKSHEVRSTIIGGQNVDYVVVTFENNVGKNEEFRFGGYHICESMAALCQEYAYKPAFDKAGFKYTSHSEYPYGLCYKIAMEIYPEFALNKILLIGLCDLSLLTYNAGLTFVSLLKYLKDNDFLDKSHNETLEQVDDLYKKGCSFIHWDAERFAYIQKIVKDEVNEYFKCDEFSGNNEWISIVFKNALELRSKHPHFIIDFLLFKEGDVRANGKFCETILKLGSPLTINDTDDGSFIPPSGFLGIKKFHPALFWAIDVVKNIFSGNSDIAVCPIFGYCKNSCKFLSVADFTDDRCKKAPWERNSDKQLCPFAVIWRHWNLSGHYPKR